MVQVKYTGLIFASVWGVFLAVNLLRQCGWRVALRWSAVAGALLAVMASPWYVYVYLGTGNPFYPFLNRWFPSPYWADGFTLQQVFERVFKMPPGVGGAVAFPWLVTYHTTSFVEGYDGFLGFWALALAPCWFLARLSRRKGKIIECEKPAGPADSSCRRETPPRCDAVAIESCRPSYWDMVVVGLAMIVGVIMYTPYVRYWLPAYPLLVASCVLAAGSLYRSIEWRPTGRWMPVTAGIALALLLLLPAPVFCIKLPWDAYAKRISREEHLTQCFQGYQATRQLNAILAPDDGVLCTGCTGVYLVGGRPYEFGFWWNRVHHIHGQKSFVEFCRRYGIHYWMVNHFSPASRCVKGNEDIVAEYWRDARLVTASGTVAVYDVASPRRKSSLMTVRREWPTIIEESDKSWTFVAPAKNWVNLAPHAAATPAKGAIALTGEAWIGHRLKPTVPGGICRVDLNLWSPNSTDPVMEITWYDAKGRLISRISGAGYGQSAFRAWICALVPADAKSGWIYLREWQRKPLRLNHAGVTFWKPPTPPAVARREKPEHRAGAVQ